MDKETELSQTIILQCLILLLLFSIFITPSAFPEIKFSVNKQPGNIQTQLFKAFSPIIPLKLVNEPFSAGVFQATENGTNNDTHKIYLPIIHRAPDTPLDFNKNSPTSGSTGISLTPTLSWKQTTPVTCYEYCYDKTNDGTCSNWISTGTNTYAGLSGLQEGATYYWQVRSWNGTYGPTYANGSASAHWSFTTVLLQPGAFNKYAPTHGSTGLILTPYLSWTTSDRATRYEYCYDTTNDGKCSNWVSTGTSRSVGLPTLQSSTTYYWQVRSWNGTYGPAYANGSGTSFWSFRTLDPGVHVLDNCSMYATTNAYVHLVCEVYNNSSSNIEDVKLYIDIYNSLGGLVDTDYAYAPIDIVHIRGKACIDISFPRPSDPDFYVELGEFKLG